MGSLSTWRIRRIQRIQRGFTLLELLIVLVIVGIVMGIVTFNALPDERQQLTNDAQRLALLMQLARDEAIVRNQPVAFESDAQGYRFLVRDENRWLVLEGDSMLHPRAYKRSPLALSINPPTAGQTNPLRLVFGREPVDRPFVLTLATAQAAVAIRADGVGHFVVE